MSPNFLITIIGGLNILIGCSVFVMSGTIVQDAFIFAEGLNEQSKIVGTLMHEALAGEIVAMGVLLLLVRGVSFAAAKKVLFGVGAALTLSLALALKHFMMPEVNPPLFALVIQALMIAAAFYVSLTAKES